jgi:adenine-specific DNA-methyltransferase
LNTRQVIPRLEKPLKEFSFSSSEIQSENLLIEGSNLHAMVSLYRKRGQIDLILTDPPYNTGKDFRYNDHCEEDPNDPSLGNLVGKMTQQNTRNGENLCILGFI